MSFFFSLNITNTTHKNKIESAVFNHFIDNEFHIFLLNILFFETNYDKISITCTIGILWFVRNISIHNHRCPTTDF